MKKTALLAGILASIATPALAYDWIVAGARPALIEGTYMPSSIPFTIDKNAGSCTAGQILTWTAQGADAPTKAVNASAILSMLETAKSTGQTLTLYGNNAGCNVVFLYLQ